MLSTTLDCYAPSGARYEKTRRAEALIVRLCQADVRSRAPFHCRASVEVYALSRAASTEFVCKSFVLLIQALRTYARSFFFFFHTWKIFTRKNAAPHLHKKLATISVPYYSPRAAPLPSLCGNFTTVRGSQQRTDLQEAGIRTRKSGQTFTCA